MASLRIPPRALPPLRTTPFSLFITRRIQPYRSQTRALSSTTYTSATQRPSHQSRYPLHAPSFSSASAFSTTTSQHVPESTIQGTIGSGAAGVSSSSTGTPSSLLAPDHLNDAESAIFGKLATALEPVQLEVQDISGGCGSMYGIEIVSERFRGLSVLKQQRLVNEVLREEIKGWHGVQLKTRAP